MDLLHFFRDKFYNVTGCPLNDSFEIAGGRDNVRIYANYRTLGINTSTNAMAGNALFWDHLPIIDFKNRKFGIK